MTHLFRSHLSRTAFQIVAAIAEGHIDTEVMTSKCLLRIVRNLFKTARHQIKIGHDPQLQEKEADRARKARREKRKKDVRTSPYSRAARSHMAPETKASIEICKYIPDAERH